MASRPIDTVTRRRALGAVAGGAALGFGTQRAAAQATVAIRVAPTSGSADILAAGERLGARLAAATSGRVILEIGAPAPGAEGLLSAGSGGIDAVLGDGDEWLAADPAFGLFSSTPFGLGPREFEAWIYHGDGQAAWDMLGAEFGVKPLLVGDLGIRPVGWFKAPVAALGDLSGRSWATSGLGATVASAWGASAVVAGTAAADIADSGGFEADIADGLPAAYPVLYTPAALRPHHAVAMVVNAAVWQSLSDTDRIAVETCCMAEADYMCGLTVNREMRGLAQLAGTGVVPQPVGADVFAAMGATATEALGAIMAGSRMPDLWRTYRDFQEEVSLWTSIGESAFSVARAKALGI